MICTENVSDKYVRTYSDEGYKILQIETGKIYSSALDTLPCKYAYEETAEPRTDANTVKMKKYEKIIDIIEGSDVG